MRDANAIVPTPSGPTTVRLRRHRRRRARRHRHQHGRVPHVLRRLFAEPAVQGLQLRRRHLDRRHALHAQSRCRCFARRRLPANAQINSPSVFQRRRQLVSRLFGRARSGVVNGAGRVARRTVGRRHDRCSRRSAPIVSRTDCAYCDTTVDFPSVIPDPAGMRRLHHVLLVGPRASAAAASPRSAAPSRPTACTFVAEPAPVLSSDLDRRGGAARRRASSSTARCSRCGTRTRARRTSWTCRTCATPTTRCTSATRPRPTASIGSARRRTPPSTVGGTRLGRRLAALLVGSVVPRDGKSTSVGLRALLHDLPRSVAIHLRRLPARAASAARRAPNLAQL